MQECLNGPVPVKFFAPGGKEFDRAIDGIIGPILI